MTDRKPYRHRFPLSIIQYALWLYHHFSLSQRNATFGGFVRNLDEAMQECQGVAEGGLTWTEAEIGLWEATDPVTLAVYEIDAREY